MDIFLSCNTSNVSYSEAFVTHNIVCNRDEERELRLVGVNK